MRTTFRNKFFTRLRFDLPKTNKGAQRIQTLSKKDESGPCFVFVTDLDIEGTLKIYRGLKMHKEINRRVFGLRYFPKLRWAEFSIPLKEEEMDDHLIEGRLREIFCEILIRKISKYEPIEINVLGVRVV